MMLSTYTLLEYVMHRVLLGLVRLSMAYVLEFRCCVCPGKESGLRSGGMRRCGVWPPWECHGLGESTQKEVVALPWARMPFGRVQRVPCGEKREGCG